MNRVGCEFTQIFGVLGKRWTLSILFLFRKGDFYRFNEIKRELGFISSKVLSERLDELVYEGLLEKKSVDSKNLYFPTNSLEDLSEKIGTFKEWHSKHKSEAF